MNYSKELNIIKMILGNFNNQIERKEIAEECFECEQCFEQIPESLRAEDSYENLGIYDLCEECYFEMLESIRG